MSNLKKLCLFLTYGQSLSTWDKNGTLLRELDIYKNLLEQKKTTLTIISYSKKNELHLLNSFELKNIKIIYNKYKLPNILFPFSLLIFNFTSFTKINIFKSNQEHGAIFPLIFSKLFFGKFIFRSGFSLRHHIKKKYSIFSIQYLYSLINNFLCCLFSSNIVITSKNYVEFYFFERKISEIPNYIPSYFSKLKLTQENKKKKYDFIYIGRLSSEKNYKLIFDIAIKIKNSKILIISNDINNYNKNIKNIIYKKNISNDKIHEYLLKSKFLVLPSNYEGQSKVMLESMYFNIPVIAKNSKGINKYIINYKNGFLFKNIDDFIETYKSINENKTLLKNISQNAYKKIVKNNLLHVILKKELKLINS